MKLGMWAMIGSGICFTVVNIIVKILSGHTNVFDYEVKKSIPAHELVLFRSIISFVICFMLLKRKNIPIIGENKKWLLIRGIFGCLALTTFFLTLQHLPMAISATLQYLSPILTLLFGVLIGHMRVKFVQWLCFLICLFGVVMIAFSGKTLTLGDVPLFWMSIGVASACFAGIAYNAIVKCKETDHSLQIVISFPIIAIPVTASICLFAFVQPSWSDWLLILIMGIFTQFAQVLLTKSLKTGITGNVTALQYLGSIYAIAAGVGIFGENLTILSFLGIGLIFAGIIINTFNSRKTEKNNYISTDE